jgi:glycerol-3-phosphate dehydrogenase
MDVVDKAIELDKLSAKKCITEGVKIHGYLSEMQNGSLGLYGADADGILDLMKSDPQLSELLHPDFKYVKAEVIWMVRNEMSRTIEDVLSRRMRLLFLDAKGALILAPAVAGIMAAELNRNETWINEQVEEFSALVKQYLLYAPLMDGGAESSVRAIA